MPREFDFAVSTELYRLEGPKRRQYLLGGAVLLFSIGTFWFLTAGLGDRGSWLLAGLAGLASVLFGICLVWIAFQPGRNLIARVWGDSEALHFDFVNGRSRKMEWGDHDFGLTVYDDTSPRETRGELSRNLWLNLESGGGLLPVVALPVLVAAARAHLVPVLVREEPTAGKDGFLREVTRIGRPESTPGWNAGVGSS